DQAGNVYVAGVTLGALGGTANDSGDAFLAKLDGLGNVLWIRQLGGPGLQQANGVGVDSAGNAYVGGIAEVLINGAPTHDFAVFLAKYDAAGNQGWIQQFGSDTSFGAEGRAVAVDAAGNAWVAGITAGPLPDETASAG